MKSGNCEKCGTWRIRLQRDHIVPKCVKRARGEDPDEVGNFQYLCANCHEDKTIADWDKYPEYQATYRTPERRLALRLANLGKKVTPRFSRLGLKSSFEHIEKIRLASTGRTHTEETKQRLSEVKVGKPNLAVSVALKGRKHPPDCKHCLKLKGAA
jgi:hypothetical protein